MTLFRSSVIAVLFLSLNASAGVKVELEPGKYHCEPFASELGRMAVTKLDGMANAVVYLSERSLRKTGEGRKADVYSWCAVLDQASAAAARIPEQESVIILDTSFQPSEKGWVSVGPASSAVHYLVERISEIEKQIEDMRLRRVNRNPFLYSPARDY